MKTSVCPGADRFRITDVRDRQYLSIPDFESPGIRHFFTTRRSGAGNPFPPDIRDAFVLVKQVHGDHILIMDKPVADMPSFVEEASQKPCDAIITNQSRIGIGVVTADCLPVLLYDPIQSVIAAVHAGWRGTIQGILPKVVCQMVYMFKSQAENIVAAMGPAIGACCYAVGEMVIEPLRSVTPEWERYLTPSEDGKAKLDLTALNRRQIEDAGVPERNIFTVGLCTACNGDLFFSYRRDGIGTGRMISGIMMAA